MFSGIVDWWHLKQLEKKLEKTKNYVNSLPNPTQEQRALLKKAEDEVTEVACSKFKKLLEDCRKSGLMS